MTRPPTRRENHGSGHSYFLDGAKVDGVTSVVGGGVPKPGLIDWASKTAAEYALDHWDELDALPPSERLEAIKRSPKSERDTLARRGTQVHRLAQALVAGEAVSVPEELKGHVEAYVLFLDTWEPAERLVEVTVGNRQRRYMGTLDLVAGLIDGQEWLLDIKTSKGVYPEAALQLNAYANAEFYLSAEGVELELPPIDAAGVVHVRADGFDLVPVDLSEETFRFFLYARHMAKFAQLARDDWKAFHFVRESLAPPRRLEVAS
jgi:hypothetical protein